MKKLPNFKIEECNKHLIAKVHYPLYLISCIDPDFHHEFLSKCYLPIIDKRQYCIKLIKNSNTNYYSLTLTLISTINENISSCVMFKSHNFNYIYNDHAFPGPTKDNPLIISDFYPNSQPISSYSFTCKITFNVENILNSSFFKQVDQISQDFGELLENKNLSDVILKTNDVELSAHRVILSARSTVFAAMFKHNTKECENGIVQIDDIEPNILHTMLDYIYTGRVNDIENKVFELFKAADKYNLEGLKLICTDVFLNKMSVQNVTNILIMTDLYSIKSLKAKALKFIKEQLKNVIATSEFKVLSITNPELVLDVLQLFVEQ